MLAFESNVSSFDEFYCYLLELCTIESLEFIISSLFVSMFICYVLFMYTVDDFCKNVSYCNLLA